MGKLKRLHRTKTIATSVIAGTIGLTLVQYPLSSTTYAAAETVQIQRISGSGTAASSSTAQPQNQNQSQNLKIFTEKDAKISKKEAETRIRALFPVLESAELTKIEFGDTNSYPPDNEAVWTLSWSIKIPNGSSGFSSRVDALTGDILSFYDPSRDDESQSKKDYPPKVSEEEARKAAENFIYKASPSLKPGVLKEVTTDYQPIKLLFGPPSYTFVYQIPVNGIPSDLESIDITLDGEGKVTSFHRSSFQFEYPSPDAAIDQSDALNKFKSDLKFSLAYVSDTNVFTQRSTGREKWHLAYVPSKTAQSYLDAKTGKMMDNTYLYQMSPAGVSFIELGEAKKPFVKHLGGQISQEEAKKVILNLVTIPEDYRFDIHLSDELPEQKVWYMNWSPKLQATPFMDHASASVDANTGQLLSYSANSYPQQLGNKQSTPLAISEAQAREKAIEIVQSYYPDASEVLKLYPDQNVTTYNGKTVYGFTFQRFYKDTPIYGGIVTLSIDGDGRLNSYQSLLRPVEGFEAELDKLKPEIRENEAFDIYVRSLGTELRYTNGQMVENGEYRQSSAELNYVPTFDDSRQLPLINAVTGKAEAGISSVSNTGNALPEVTDIKDHHSFEALQTMLEFGILEPDDKGLVHPDAGISLGEWLQMLTKASAGYTMAIYEPGAYSDVPMDSPYAEAVQFSNQKGWLKPFKEKELRPEQPLTREMTAAILSNVVHYNALSAFLDKDAAVASLTDAASIHDKGAVALALKLGLMETSGGKFEPEKQVTKADAAEVLMKLVKLQGKVDTPY